MGAGVHVGTHVFPLLGEDDAAPACTWHPCVSAFPSNVAGGGGKRIEWCNRGAGHKPGHAKKGSRQCGIPLCRLIDCLDLITRIQYMRFSFVFTKHEKGRTKNPCIPPTTAAADAHSDGITYQPCCVCDNLLRRMLRQHTPQPALWWYVVVQLPACSSSSPSP
jgi:hypothetical protein